MLDRAPAPRIEEVMADQLLPDALTDLWETVDEQLFTGDQFYSEQQRLLELHRDVWREALVLNGYTDLR
jgi:hypothetical protein